jgi:hypothetical protein
MLLRILGSAFWIVLLVSAVKISAPLRESTSSGNATIASYLSGPQQAITALDPSKRLRLYDPIFYQNQDGSWRQVGYVKAKSASDSGNRIVLSWYARDVPESECELIQYHDSGSLQTVVTTMFPAEKRQQIQQRIAAAMAQHGEELTRAFVPLVRQSLQESIPIIEAGFRQSVRSHRDEIDALADQWNQEIVEQRLLPMARREIMPIVRRHGQPVAEEIGMELWDRASLWRFGWRALYDKTPFTRRNLVRQEWERFTEEEAIPVFESHLDDVVVAVQRTLQDVSANRRVRAEVSKVADELVQDPQTRQLVRIILKETLLDNEELRTVWTNVWSSPRAQRALNLAGDRLEPIVRKIGDDLFGSEDLGIDPNFARVLRSQILRKDRRWIVANRTGNSSERIELATTTMQYPIIYLADRAAETP